MEKTKELENVIVSQEGNIATIILNRPHALNAMSPGLMRDLEAALDIIAEDESVRVVIVTGKGRAFCAGGDVKEDVSQVSSHTAFEYRKYIRDFSAAIRKIVRMEKPVIAAIRGYAVGGGLDLAMACDIRVAAKGTRLGNAYLRMGIMPELGGIYLLPRLIGLGKAKLLALTGDFITAEEAGHMGLVEKVVPEEELDGTVKELAEKLASGPPKAIGLTKIAMNKSLAMDFESCMDYCWHLGIPLIQSEDQREAVAAFLEKRKPIFKGK